MAENRGGGLGSWWEGLKRPPSEKRQREKIGKGLLSDLGKQKPKEIPPPPPAQLPTEIEIEGQLVPVTWVSDKVIDSNGEWHIYYCPQIPIEALNYSSMLELANYLYEQRPMMDEAGQYLTTDGLPYDRTKGDNRIYEYKVISPDTAKLIDTEKLMQGLNYLALAGEYGKRFNIAPSGDVENYLLARAGEMYEKNIEPSEDTWRELGLLLKYPTFGQTLRRQGKLPPLTPAEEKVRLEQEAATRRDVESAFQSEGTFQSEKAQAEDTLRRLKPIYEQYKEQLELGVVSELAPGTVTQQLGVAGVRGYESAQQKLADIESGKVTGWQYEGSNLEAEAKTKEQAIETDWQRLRGQAKRQRIAERFTKI